MTYQEQAANLRLQAAINRRYADANIETIARTGGKLGSLNNAAVHEACAARKEAQADDLERR